MGDWSCVLHVSEGYSFILRAHQPMDLPVFFVSASLVLNRRSGEGVLLRDTHGCGPGSKGVQVH
jgi:hypothetical protein